MGNLTFGRCAGALILAAAVGLAPGMVEGQTVPLAKAQPGPLTAVPAASQMQILTYDVGDLILDVPDYPYLGSGISSHLSHGSRGGGMPGMGGMGGMGGGMDAAGGGYMSVPDQMGSSTDALGATQRPGQALSTSRITIEDLKRVILTVIAPDTWAENGGQEGELQHLGTALIIRQSPAVHKEIESLLEQLRKGSGKQNTVAIDARWLLLDSDELERLMPPNDQGEPRIDRKTLAEFTRRPSSIRGQTNCFTGQLVYLVSGTRRNVVTSFVPVVGSLDRPLERQYAALAGEARVVPAQALIGDRAVGYQPVIDTPNLGVLLQIRPTLVPGQAKAIVDLQSTLTVLADSSPDLGVPAEKTEDPLVPKVDRVAIETQELATTLSVPLGQPVLAGGLTYIGPSADAARQIAAKEKETGVEAPQLYLVLELK